MTTPYDIAPQTLGQTERRWQDLRSWRLFLGLCLGPILPATLLLGVEFISDNPTAGEFIWIFAFFFLAIAWSQITGWIYLLAVARPRGWIARRGCMLLGLTSIAVIPPIAVFFAALPSSQADPESFLEDLNQKPAETIAALVVTEIACALFGVWSGWLFWRFGVRPAATIATPPASHPSAQPPRRVFAALLLAAVPMGIAMIPSAQSDLAVLGLLLLTCPGIWLIAGGLYAKWRITLRLNECLFLGMLLGFLLMPALLLLSGLIGQFTNPQPVSVIAPFRTVGLTAIIRAGQIELPFGLLGGWLFWRMAGPLPVSPGLERRWRDLHKGRVLAALIVAPAASFIMFATLSALAYGLPSDPTLGAARLGSALLTFVAWCFAISLFLLFLICRRGGVRMRDCLFSEAFAFCLFPSLEVVLKFGLGVGGDLIGGQAGAGGILFHIVATALAYLPFGLLSGWIFWRIGVQPAKEPEVGVAAVFD